MDTKQFIETLCEDGCDTNTIIDFVNTQQARIDELEYALSVSMFVHDDAENMTGAQRDALAMMVLDC